MKALLYRTPGGPEVLEFTDVDDPTAGARDVVIDVAATALNHLDVVQRAQRALLGLCDRRVPRPRDTEAALDAFPGVRSSAGRLAVIALGLILLGLLTGTASYLLAGGQLASDDAVSSPQATAVAAAPPRVIRADAPPPPSPPATRSAPCRAAWPGRL